MLDARAACLSSSDGETWTRDGCTVVDFVVTSVICSCTSFSSDKRYGVSIIPLKDTIPPGPGPEGSSIGDIYSSSNNDLLTKGEKVLIVLVGAVGGIMLIVLIYFKTRGLKKQEDKKTFDELNEIWDDQDGDEDFPIPPFVDEEEQRDYSIGSIEEFSDTDYDTKDYSIGIDDFSEDEPEEDTADGGPSKPGSR